MIVDLHVNIKTPDGDAVEPEKLIEAAKAAGLDGMVLAREGTISPDLSAYQEAAAREDIKLFSGAAITTNQGVILAILPSQSGLGDDFAPQEEGVYDAHAAIDAVEAAGGATVALRPYDRDLPHPMGDHVFSLQGLDACEVISGRVSEIANDLALEAASNLEMPCIGTSSAQGLEGFGTAATLLRRPVDNVDGLIQLVKQGDCWPVAFYDDLPEEARLENSRGRRRDGDSGRGRPRSGGRGVGGRRDRGSRSDGGGEGDRRRNDGRRGGESRDAGPRGGRRRRGRSGGGGKGSVRVTSAPEHADRLPDDYGNRMRSESDDSPSPPDDIGNRLRPGETSPFHDAVRREDEE